MGAGGWGSTPIPHFLKKCGKGGGQGHICALFDFKIF